MGLSEETKNGSLWRDQEWVLVERPRMGHCGERSRMDHCGETKNGSQW